jgi:hypothetical protein
VSPRLAKASAGGIVGWEPGNEPLLVGVITKEHLVVDAEAPEVRMQNRSRGISVCSPWIRPVSPAGFAISGGGVASIPVGRPTPQGTITITGLSCFNTRHRLTEPTSRCGISPTGPRP